MHLDTGKRCSAEARTLSDGESTEGEEKAMEKDVSGAECKSLKHALAVARGQAAAATPLCILASKGCHLQVTLQVVLGFLEEGHRLRLTHCKAPLLECWQIV